MTYYEETNTLRFNFTISEQLNLVSINQSLPKEKKKNNKMINFSYESKVNDRKGQGTLLIENDVFLTLSYTNLKKRVVKACEEDMEE